MITTSQQRIKTFDTGLLPETYRRLSKSVEQEHQWHSLAEIMPPESDLRIPEQRSRRSLLVLVLSGLAVLLLTLFAQGLFVKIFGSVTVVFGAFTWFVYRMSFNGLPDAV